MPIPLSTTQLLAVASEVLTVPAAPSSSLDAARRWTIVPQGGGADRVVMVALAAQGIVTTDLTISIESLRGSARVLPLPPSLRLDELLVIGDEHEGIQLTIRNKRQAQVPVTIWLAALTRQELDRYISGEVAGLPAVTANYVVRSEDLAGAAITTPLADVGGRPAWYDRNANQQLINADTTRAPHSTTVRGSYTVPSAKLAHLASIFIRVTRVNADSAPGIASAFVFAELDGGNFFGTLAMARLDAVSNTPGDFDSASLHVGGFLRPGDTIEQRTFDNGTDGSVYYLISTWPIEFDL